MVRVLLFLVLFVNYAVNGFVVTNSRIKREVEVTSSEENAEGKENARCNNAELEKVMQDSIGEDVKQSKLRIMEQAEQKLGGTFNVICAQGDFSYITSTRIYCLTGNESVKCYAFLADSSHLNKEEKKRL